ncbi:MAG: hypothetical protein HQL54_13355 [Magnetococcales bacterium]|nr:hypothetical protein [Magnetococcales bacterium]
MNNTYLLGLDLGQAGDYTGLTIFECLNNKRPPVYHLRHVERLKLGLSYPKQVDLVAERLARIPGISTLVLDATGVGRPVVDMIRQRRLLTTIIAVTITGGNTVNETDKDTFTVPKRDLVSTLQVLFQNARLKVAQGLPQGELLIEELLNFKVKINVNNHDSYEAWRDKDHDDLVLSAALALWYAERKPPVEFSFIPVPKSTLFGESARYDPDDDENESSTWGGRGGGY